MGAHIPVLGDLVGGEGGHRAGAEGGAVGGQVHRYRGGELVPVAAREDAQPGGGLSILHGDGLALQIGGVADVGHGVLAAVNGLVQVQVLPVEGLPQPLVGDGCALYGGVLLHDGVGRGGQAHGKGQHQRTQFL